MFYGVLSGDYCVLVGMKVAVCTPGRMIDLLKMKACNFLRATYLVFDEADRMFDMGFEPQVCPRCFFLTVCSPLLLTWPNAWSTSSWRGGSRVQTPASSQGRRKGVGGVGVLQG